MNQDQIQFIDLHTQQDRIRPQIEKRIQNVLAHGKYILGPEINELEKRLAVIANVKYAITCSSGTDALLLPLIAYDIRSGDAIFTTSFTFIATAEVIALLGATPVFVDIDPQTFNIDPQKLEEAINSVKKKNELRPRGIIPVDLFGLPADYDSIRAVADRHELFVLEDAAQSFGGTYKGRKVGSLGQVAATSFFPAKPLGCYGDGGAVFTDNDGIAEKLKSIRVHGKGSDKYDNVRIGLNARFDTIQAAILLEKLEIFPEEIIARNRIATHYTESLSKLPYLQPPIIPEQYTSAWAQYSVLAENRDQLREKLSESGIPSVVYYPKPLHLQTVFAFLGHVEGDFPISESISKRIFSLPMHPYLTESQIERTITAFSA